VLLTSSSLRVCVCETERGRHDTDTQTDKGDKTKTESTKGWKKGAKACIVCVSHIRGCNLCALKTVSVEWPRSMGKRLEMVSPLAAQFLVEGGNS